MKKLSLVVILLLATAGVWFYSSRQQNAEHSSVGAGPSASGTTMSSSDTTQQNRTSLGDPSLPEGNDGDDGEGENDQSDRPATELYKSAEEALAAVKQGASSYDDVILEQFTQLGPECTWCDSFYKGLRDTLSAPDLPSEQRAYFAELLAVSGRVDNIETLVNSIENPVSPDIAQTYSEALEMTSGGDEVVTYLSSKLSTSNSSLKESLVAAITNQGSPLAVETLYRVAVQSGNPDGYYSDGTGLGEAIPEEGAYPMLKDWVQKKDDYSHLAVKALLNAGDEGVRIVLDSLTTSNDPEADQKILKDSEDHVSYSEETEKMLKETVERSKNPKVVEWAKNILDSFNENEDAAAADNLPEGDLEGAEEQE